MYELHVGSFSPEGTFAGATSRLEHVKVRAINDPTEGHQGPHEGPSRTQQRTISPISWNSFENRKKTDSLTFKNCKIRKVSHSV
jgi:hypothetical protein